MMQMKAPSITSLSGNDQDNSSNKLRKNSQSLVDMDPQQAYDIFQTLYRRDPDKLKSLMREAGL